MDYRAAIVGTGKVAHDHAATFEETDGLELVGIVDPDESQLASFGTEWDVPDSRRYRDHGDLLAKAEIDLVSVTAPTWVRPDVVVDLAESDRSPAVIWTEKPMALSVHDAERMVDACESADIELVVNHVRRFAPGIESIRKLVSQDELLGDLYSVSSQLDRELLLNGTHLVDALLYMLDARVDRVSGYLTGEEGLTEKHESSRALDDCGGGGSLVTTDGTLVTVDATVDRRCYSGWYQFTGRDGRLSVNERDNEFRYWTITDDEHLKTDVSESPDLIYDRWDCFLRAGEHLVALLEGTEANRSPGREAVHGLEVLVGLFVSHYTESQISLPLEEPLRDVTIDSW